MAQPTGSNPFAALCNPFAAASAASAAPAAAGAGAASRDSISPAPSGEAFGSTNPFTARSTAAEERPPYGAGSPSREEAIAAFGISPFASGKSVSAAPSASLLPHPYLKFLINPAEVAARSDIRSYLANSEREFALNPKDRSLEIAAAPLFSKDPMGEIVAECRAPFDPLVTSSSAIKRLVDAEALKNAGKPVLEQVRAYDAIIKQVYRTALPKEVQGLVEIALRRGFTIKLIEQQRANLSRVTHSLDRFALHRDPSEKFPADFFTNIEIMHQFTTRMGTFATDIDPAYELTRPLIGAKALSIHLEFGKFNLTRRLALAKGQIDGTLGGQIDDILGNIATPAHRALLKEDIAALIKGKALEMIMKEAEEKLASTIYANQKEAFAGLDNEDSLASILVAINSFCGGYGAPQMLQLLKNVFSKPSSDGRIFPPEIQDRILSDLLAKPRIAASVLPALFEDYKASR